jgi:hypothetical protein
MSAQHNPPKHYLRDFQVGFGFALPGVIASVVLFKLRMWEGLAVTIPMVVIGALALRSGFARYWGGVVEKTAIASLKWPSGWQASANQPLSKGGDVDLLVEGPDGERFAIEIKSQSDAQLKTGWLGLGTPKVVDSAGRKLKGDPIGQAIANADAMAAQAVLWFPKARIKKTSVLPSKGLIVVMGGNKPLLKAIGARVSWWSF